MYESKFHLILEIFVGIFDFSVLFHVSCLKLLLKFLEIPENSQEFLASFQIQSLRESHWCSELEFLEFSQKCQVLFAIDLEFLGISRFLEPELLQLGIPRNSEEKIPRNSQDTLGIPRNSKIHFANVIVQTAISANID